MKNNFGQEAVSDLPLFETTEPLEIEELQPATFEVPKADNQTDFMLGLLNAAWEYSMTQEKLVTLVVDLEGDFTTMTSKARVVRIEFDGEVMEVEGPEYEMQEGFGAAAAAIRWVQENWWHYDFWDVELGRLARHTFTNVKPEVTPQYASTGEYR